MEGELERVGLKGDPRVAFHDAHRAETAAPWRRSGEQGVFTSHLQCLEEAAAAGKSLLILDDDAETGADRITAPVMPHFCAPPSHGHSGSSVPIMIATDTGREGSQLKEVTSPMVAATVAAAAKRSAASHASVSAMNPPLDMPVT